MITMIQARQHSGVQRSDGNFQSSSSLCHRLCSSHGVGGQVIIMMVTLDIETMMRIMTRIMITITVTILVTIILVRIMISRGSGLPTLGSPTPKSVAPTEGGSVRSGSVLAHYPGRHYHE